MSVHRYCWLCLVPVVVAASMVQGDEPDEKKGGDPVVTQVLRLERYVTDWLVREHHFNLKGEQIATVKGNEEIVWILGKRAIQRTYTTKTDSTSYRAIGTLTWNDVTKKYQGVWIDNVSTTGPTTVEAEWNEKDQTMIYTVDSLAKNGSTVRHRVLERFLDDDNREAVTYLLRGSEVIKRLEVQYQRTIPCPGRGVRRIDELTQ